MLGAGNDGGGAVETKMDIAAGRKSEVQDPISTGGDRPLRGNVRRDDS